MTTLQVFIPGGTHRTSGTLPVRPALRPAASPHWQPGFCPIFQRLAAPIDRPHCRNYDYIETMSLDEATNWPVVGEA